MECPWIDIGLSLGSNVGDGSSAIAEAFCTLEARGHIRLDRVSSLYKTPPWGPVVQADFTNACALASTDLAPHALLAEIKAVEAMLGRETSVRWGPRRIDIDILFYAGETVNAPDLVIPHESLFQRAFVLIPLAEIAPGLRLGGKNIAEAAAAIPKDGVARWGLQRFTHR